MGLFSKPEVVIAKESSNAKEYLRQLEELAEKAAGENAKKIAKEIAVVKAGIIGEDNILFELKTAVWIWLYCTICILKACPVPRHRLTFWY